MTLALWISCNRWPISSSRLDTFLGVRIDKSPMNGGRAAGIDSTESCRSSNARGGDGGGGSGLQGGARACMQEIRCGLGNTLGVVTSVESADSSTLLPSCSSPFLSTFAGTQAHGAGRVYSHRERWMTPGLADAKQVSSRQYSVWLQAKPRLAACSWRETLASSP